MARKRLFGLIPLGKSKSDTQPIGDEELLTKKNYDENETDSSEVAAASQDKKSAKQEASPSKNSPEIITELAEGNTDEPEADLNANDADSQSMGNGDALSQHEQHEEDAAEGITNEYQNAEDNGPIKVTDIEDSDISYVNNQDNDEFNAPAVLTRPIIVSFMYAGRKVANDFVFVGSMGKQLTLKDLPHVPGYRLADNQKFEFVISQQTQYVQVKLVEEVVTYQLIPVDEAGNIIDVNWVRTRRGQLESLIPKKYMPQIPGYEASLIRDYKVQKDTVKVTYIPQVQHVAVHFLTEDGDALDDIVLSGNTGSKYTIKPEEHHFEGYELTSMPDHLSGTFEPENRTIKIEYAPVKTSVKVTFLDETGNDIHRALIFPGHYGQTFNLRELGIPVIDGYELVNDPTDLSGTFRSESQQIVLRFKRAHQSFKIHYWFDKKEQKSASEDFTVTGLTGDFYKVNSPKLDGYEAKPDIITGVFDAFENADVDVVYQPIQAVIRLNFEDEAGRVIESLPSIEQEGNFGDDYHVELPEIAGYVRPSQYVDGKFRQRQETKVIRFQPEESTVEIRYIDARTSQPIKGYESTVLSGPVGTAFSVDPKMIDGYKLNELPGDASGIFTANKRVVELKYQPNKSQIVIEFRDKANNELMMPKTFEGYFGQQYSLEEEILNGLKGYSLDPADNEKLHGAFPTNRQTIKLYLQSKPVQFTLVAVDQFKKPINHKYDIQISGLPGQRFSHGLPKIPGYSSKAADVGSTIKPEMNNSEIKIGYVPNASSVIFHFLCIGGPHDQINPYPDYELPGRTGDSYNYEVPDVEGYEPQQASFSGVYEPQTKYLDIKYQVKTESYLIEFIGKNGEVIDRSPMKQGEYGLVVNVDKAVPSGYHLPAGTPKSITLNGQSTYSVNLQPDNVLVEMVAKSKDGDDLSYRRQVNGEYHQQQQLQAPLIPGYKPVNGNTLTINFEKDQKQVIVYYAPEPRKLTVRFIDTQGNNLRDPAIIEGHFSESYSVKAPRIDGYFAVGEKEKSGRYEMQDTETAFIYRAGSDELNPAITPLEDLIVDDKETSHNTQVGHKVANKGQESPEATFTGPNVENDQPDFYTTKANSVVHVEHPNSSIKDTASSERQEGVPESNSNIDRANKETVDSGPEQGLAGLIIKDD